MVLLCIVAVAALYFLLVNVLGIDASAVAAIASAVAAFAALGSANASSDTARDALRALSFATKPVLRVQRYNDQEGSDVLLVISNVSLHEIARARVTWRLRDGRTGSEELGGLEGRRTPAMGAITGESPSYPQINLGQHPGEVDGKDVVTIEYWGTQGPTGWRFVAEWNFINTRGTLPDGTATAGYSVGQTIKPEVEIR
jgi:hypothetical protein